jgi:hypothetical protein
VTALQKKIARFFFAVLIMTGVSFQASAYQRMKEPYAVALMKADHIVIVQVSSVTSRQTGDFNDPFQVAFKTLSNLKGMLDPSIQTLPLHRHYSTDIASLEPGKKFIFFIFKGSLLMDGTQAHSKHYEQKIIDDIRRLPAWSKPQDGLSTAIVPEEFTIAESDNLDASFLVKNVGSRGILLKYHNLPLQSQTHWKLRISRETGDLVVPLPHPHLTQASMKEFEATQRHSYDTVLQPGQIVSFYLPRINSAEPGWGYKSELDFKYYPLPAGRYQMAAESHELLPGHILTTSPVRFQILKNSAR